MEKVCHTVQAHVEVSTQDQMLFGSGIFVEVLCLVGRLSLNSLSVCAITVRVEPDLHVSPTSETSQTWL